MSNLFANYKRASVKFQSGSGCFLYDEGGKEYLDFLSGIAVCNLGHSHPKLVAALNAQVSRLLHVSNLYEIPEQEEAARKLVELCGLNLDRVFFCNSGAEANECLIKMARKYAHAKGLSPQLVVAKNGFHGRTLATVSATGTPKYHEGFAPLVPGFKFVDYNNLDQALDALESSCGILLEPVQGEGGVIPADREYLQKLEQTCRKQGKLFLLDEVQTGIGRTGYWLAAHHYNVNPDALSLAKGLGSGIPVGAVMARKELSELMTPGSHGTTFGGNPLAATAVATVLNTIQEEGLLEHVSIVGETLQESLRALPGVKSVRGLGLMAAAITERSAAEIAEEAFQMGLLVNAVRPNALRLTPPLVVQEHHIKRAVEILGPIMAGGKGGRIHVAI